MKKARVIFPHPGLSRKHIIYFCEDPFFFFDPDRPFRFHKMKLVLHRASMQNYAAKLEAENRSVRYLAYEKGPSLDLLFKTLVQENVDALTCFDVRDTVLDPGLRREAERTSLRLKILPSPAFLTPMDWAAGLFPKSVHYSQIHVYIAQGKRLGILLRVS
jgi:deoxyribodipyrimidine photolyase-related protein